MNLNRRIDIILLVALVGSLCIVLVQQHGKKRGHAETPMLQRIEESNRALKKTAEFLQPDTTSDIRFGQSINTPSPKP